jgi:hypothetical protein
VEEHSANLLLGKEFLVKCSQQYTLSGSRGWFNEKEISIVDPVDPSNNIGKSVKRKLEFIGGLADAYSKFNSIIASGGMLMHNPFGGSDSSELADLEGDLNQMINCVAQAKELHKLIKRAPQRPLHLSHDSTHSSDQLRPQPPGNTNTPNYPPPLTFDHNHWSQGPPLFTHHYFPPNPTYQLPPQLFTHHHPHHTTNPNLPWLTTYELPPPPLFTHHHPHHTPNPNLPPQPPVISSANHIQRPLHHPHPHHTPNPNLPPPPAAHQNQRPQNQRAQRAKKSRQVWVPKKK